MGYLSGLVFNWGVNTPAMMNVWKLRRASFSVCFPSGQKVLLIGWYAAVAFIRLLNGLPLLETTHGQLAKAGYSSRGAAAKRDGTPLLCNCALCCFYSLAMRSSASCVFS